MNLTIWRSDEISFRNSAMWRVDFTLEYDRHQVLPAEFRASLQTAKGTIQIINLAFQTIKISPDILKSTIQQERR